MALVPQPGAVQGMAADGSIVSLEDMGFDIDELNATFGEYFLSLGEYNGKHYGMPTNINLKSMVWYPKDDVRRGRLHGPRDLGRPDRR